MTDMCFDRSAWIHGSFVLCLIIPAIGVIGCQSSGQNVEQGGDTSFADGSTSSTNGDEDRTEQNGIETNGTDGGNDLDVSKEEVKQMRKNVAELMVRFSSDDPAVWKQTATKINQFGESFIPEVFRKRIQQAKKQGEEGRKARKQLARWGKLKSIVLELPSRNPDRWNDVRRRMFNEGPEGKEMFIRHMINFLKTSGRSRQLAAEQLARSGKSTVDNAWDHMEKLASGAREASRRNKTIPHAMVLLQGLAQVQVNAGRWQRIRSALQHRYVRIRLAMTEALAQADDVSRASKLLGRVINQEKEYRIRIAAVTTLGVFDRHEEPIEPLRDALLDSNQQVVESAADELRYFHDHEQDVVRSMIEVLGKIKNDRTRRKHRQIIFKTLRKITDASSVNNSYRAWAAWYRSEYD